MSADLLRRAADKMEGLGFVHAAIAEGLRDEASLIESGARDEAAPESLNLARTYLGESE